jgi:NADP-dependent 3-hydroxy acid dehydrogenase YdfG
MVIGILVTQKKLVKHYESSIGGRIGVTPFGTAYHASKFAIEGLTESLRHELAEFNIKYHTDRTRIY